RAKYEAFNWHVIEVDGHNIRDIVDACREAEAIYEKPTMIIAHTIAGKGVSYMERDFEWHGKPPAPGKEAEIAISDLRTLGGRIESEHE
ncbi:MAG: transketolase, partial [Candidatus Spechtbacteria bacterium]|nr:transketolase [Candidatus Spechtbacteria bacterium]